MSISENIINAFKEQNKNGFLLAEIISIIERVTNNNELPTIESCGVILNPVTYQVITDNKSKQIPKKEFQLLYYFISNKNKIIHRKNILRDVWGADVWVDERTIDVHIRKLRRVLGKGNLKTIKCVGYGWVEK
jgi:two-component system alkaline phosphatase synthesis response regulator PhoP